MIYPHLLDGFKCQFLNMKTVDDSLCTRESMAAYAVHAVSQIKRYLRHFIAQTAVSLPSFMQYCI